MKIDCFFCTCADDPLRLGLATATLQRLKCDDSLNVTVLRTPEAWLDPQEGRTVTIDCSKKDFQHLRRKMAEELAESEIYMVADDDCLLMEPDFVDKGVSILGDNPEFVQLSGFPTNSTIMKWLPEDYITKDGSDIQENQSICGTYFQRKGFMTEFPEPAGHSYSRVQADWFRERGFRVGLSPRISFNHMGEGYGTWPPS